ncbi:MAG: hypothetical protein HGB10_01725 [Coriobacteriia bacterium]|nr:hypothetical protein [Coriobacteriia bacterium]
MKRRIGIVIVAAVALVAALAGTAQAYPSKTSACTGCHASTTSTTVTAVQTANNGTTATYSVTVGGSGTLNGWTVLNGSTMVANGSSATGTFQVPVGSTYTVWGVSKTAASMAGAKSISISPTAPIVTPPPSVDPTVTPPSVNPTGTITATSTVTMRIKLTNARKSLVTLTSTTTGVKVIGKVGRVRDGRATVTFANVANGDYKLTAKTRGHRSKTLGMYTVLNGTIARTVVIEAHDDDHETDGRD